MLSVFEGEGGILTEEACGAVAGGLAPFSYCFGRTYEQWQEKVMIFEAADFGVELIKRFKDRYGGIR